MKTTKRTVTKTVKVLTDANPTFVSLVGHGANQTPFKVVKLDDTGDNHQHQTMKLIKKSAQETSLVTKGASINKVVFDGTKFTEATAKAWLEGKGYSDFTVEKLENSLVVKGDDENGFESIAPIKADEGVTLFVGKLANPPADDAGAGGTTTKTADAPAAASNAPAAEAGAAASVETGDGKTAKAAGGSGATAVTTTLGIETPQLALKSDKEIARKVDSYVLYYGKAVTIAEALDDAKDGLPVGYYDIQSAFTGVLKNLILGGNIEGITALTQEFGALIQKLATLTVAVSKEERETTVAKLFVETAAVPATEATKKQDEGQTQTPVQKTDEGDALQTAIAKALAPLVEKLNTIDPAKLATKEDITGIREEVTKTANRVTEIESVRQTRKGAGADDLAPATAKKENDQSKTYKVEDPALRRQFGMA